MDRAQFDQSFQALNATGIPYGDDPRDTSNMKGPGD